MMPDDDARERFEERAAILEYCANLTRAEAEAAARSSLYRGPRRDPISERQARELGRGTTTPLGADAAPAQGGVKACVETATAPSLARGPRLDPIGESALNDMKRILK